MADDAKGPNVPNQFRLGTDVTARLDELVRLFSEESGDRETRSSVVRKLINREHQRRTAEKKSKKPK